MIKSERDFITGLLFIAIGLFFSIAGLQLDYGTPANMGPGFLPMTVSVLLIAIGMVQVFRGIKSEGSTVKFKFKQPLIILTAIVAFGLLLETIGAIISVLVLMLITAYLHKSFTLRNFCLSYLFVVGLMLIFKLALRSPIPLWIL
jgi:hypothetical protein